LSVTESHRFYEEVIKRVRNVSGVEAAGIMYP